MDQNYINNQSKFDLPSPSGTNVSGSPVPGALNQNQNKSDYHKTNNPVNTPLPSSGPTTNPIVPPTPGSNTHKASLQAIPTPEVAEDSDLIEQEWVDKAKAIVEHTKQDPHKQSIEINKIKADYIKKRYNKEIKTGSD